jgi:YVTN family beta-propeller protein
MDYSEYSGKFYNGATSPLTCAVTVVDTTQEDLPVSCIPAGSGPGQIPAAGYVHIAHEGKTVYTVGSKDGLEEGDPGTGWLSAIDATDNDKVIAVIELGDVSVGSIDENGKKAYLPSSNRRAKTNVAAVVDIDPTSATYHQFLGDVTIGESGSHRNGEVTSDGKLAFYPNTCEECNTVSVINTKTDTEIAQLPVGSHATDVGIEGLHTPYK